MTKLSVLQLAFLALGGCALGQKVNGEDYNKPDGGPPADYFAADKSLSVDEILSAVSKLSKEADSYPISDGSDKQSKIYSDWASFDDVSWPFSRPVRLPANDDRALRSSGPLTWMSTVMGWIKTVKYGSPSSEVSRGLLTLRRGMVMARAKPTGVN